MNSGWNPFFESRDFAYDIERLVLTGKDPSPAMLKMKKSELAAHAAKAVADTSWLPAILRVTVQRH